MPLGIWYLASRETCKNLGVAASRKQFTATVSLDSWLVFECRQFDAKQERTQLIRKVVKVESFIRLFTNENIKNVLREKDLNQGCSNCEKWWLAVLHSQHFLSLFFVVNDYREKHLWELQLRLKKKKKPPGTDADIRLRLFSVVVEFVVHVIDAVVS